MFIFFAFNFIFPLAMAAPESCQQSLKNPSSIRLWHGEASMQEVRDAIQVVVRSWEYAPEFLITALRKAQGANHPTFNFLPWQFLDPQSRFIHGSDLSPTFSVILSSMALTDSNGKLQALRSPLWKRSTANLLRERRWNLQQGLSEDQHFEYLKHVDQVAAEVRSILAAEGIEFSIPQSPYLPLSLLSVAPNGAIAVSFDSSGLLGHDTLPESLLTCWGRYRLFQDLKMVPSAEQIRKIHSQLSQRLNLRLVQSEELYLILQGDIYEVGQLPDGRPMPDLYKHNKASNHSLMDVLRLTSELNKRSEERQSN